MTLPIDSAALTAQSTAEHEYGERLMSAAEVLAMADGADVVSARHIERAAKALDVRTWPASQERTEIDPLEVAACELQQSLGGWVDGCIRVVAVRGGGKEYLAAACPALIDTAKIPRHWQGFDVVVGTNSQIRCICAERYGVAKAG